MEKQIEIVKQQINLLYMCQEKGMVLKRIGISYQALCPFHEETNPSFTIYPDKNRYHCFGCGKHGDVIDFVMESDGISFPEALRKLCNKGDICMPDNFDKEYWEKQKIIEEILDNASFQFHYNFINPKNPNRYSILGYVERRGIEWDSYLRFKIGYAPSQDNLIPFLKLACGYEDEDIIKSGLAWKDNIGNLYPFFRNRIIFPYLRNGKAFYFTGRALNDNDKTKYLNLPTNEYLKKGIYNLDSLNFLSKEIHITEGPIDAILAEQKGFPTIALTGSPIKEHQAKKMQDKKVYIVFDNDRNRAGQEKAIKLATQLHNWGIESKIVPLPTRPGKSKVDLADYLFFEEKEALEALKKESLTIIDYKIEEISKRPKDEFTKLIKEEIFPLLFKLDEMIATHWMEKIKEKIGLKTHMYNALRKEYRKAKEEYEKREALRQAEAKKEYKMTSEEEKEALEYLENPNLLEYLKNDFRSIGIVGEELNALSLYLFSLTRKTDEPISAVLFGDSSSGKSYVVNSIRNLIPDEDVLDLTSASPKSFEHANEMMLKHKFIVIQEIHGMGEVQEIIRQIQSEGKLSRLLAKSDPKTGDIYTIQKKVECPACIITTTTWDRVHQENSTRIFELYLDQSQEQTQRIQDLQKERATEWWIEREAEIKKTEKLHQNIQRLIKPFKVIIPWAKYIDFPTDTTRNRRDSDRFLNLIRAVALLRQYQKEIKKKGDIEYIEADIEDYKIAHPLGIKLLASTLSPISDRTRDLAKVVLALPEGKKEEFTRADVRKQGKEMGVQITSNNNILVKQLESLEEIGAIETIQGGPGKTYKYKLKISDISELDDLTPNLIPTPEEIEDKIQQEEKEIDEIFGPEQTNTD